MNTTISNEYFIGSMPVLIHPGWGGFYLDAYLKDQFNNIFGVDNYCYINPSIAQRSHPSVISLFQELFNQQNSKIFNGLSFVYIPEEYILHNAVSLSEYDGMEKIELNTHKLAIEMIREITNDTSKSQSTKLKEISDVLATII